MILIHSKAVTLRPEKPEDEPLLFELYSSARKEELDATGWPAEMRTSFLTMQFRAQRQGYAALFPQGEFQIILIGGIEAGRIVVDRTPEEIRLADVVILPEHRNQGIGSALIKKLIYEAAIVRKPLRLHADKGGRAAKLYQRLGFRIIGTNDIHDEMEWLAPSGEIPKG